MAKTYSLKFGSGNPVSKTGLSPTFTMFATTADGLLQTPPGITEFISSGLYIFNYGVTNQILFICDGGASLADSDRYNVGVLDPIQAVDQKVGTIQDSFGNTLSDPTTLMGFAKRTQEFSEGNAIFTKQTGVWVVSSRGSSTALFSKALTNNTTQATKS